MTAWLRCRRDNVRAGWIGRHRLSRSRRGISARRPLWHMLLHVSLAFVPCLYMNCSLFSILSGLMQATLNPHHKPIAV